MGVAAGDAGDFIIKLATTVNRLENTTTASASNIISAMQNMISAASGLGQDAAPSVVAFAATLYDLGIEARSAGTIYNRMAQYIASNTQRIADLMGVSLGEIRERFDKDFTGSLVDLMGALGEVESRTSRMQIAQEIFGKRAGRGVTLLSENMDELVSNLELANSEFHHGDSLIREYNDAMQSAQAQLGILRNNLQVAAATLGQTFLPLVNKAVAWIVPLVQKLTESFAALPTRFKYAAAAGAALLAVIGPLSVIFSTLIFSASMIVTGLANISIAVGGLMTSMTTLIPAIAAVGAGLLGLGRFAEHGVSKIGDVFISAADAAESWGLGIVSSLAAGMLRGIATVVNAAVQVANAIAGFFASHSPPKEGPLRKIGVWGKNLIQTFISGFDKADFSAVEEVTNKVASYFRSLSSAGLLDESDVVPNILAVRHAFTELLDTFESTGKVSDSILSNINSRLGEAGNRVEKWLRLYLRVHKAQEQYNDASKRLEEIRDLRAEINDTYEDEASAIKSSGKPVLEQLRMVGRARRQRDNSLDVLSDEERQQRNVRDEAKAHLEQQKSLLDAQEGLVDYYQNELDLLEDQERAAGGVAGAIGGAGGAADAMGEFAGALSDAAGVDLAGMLDGAGSTIEDMLAGIQTIPESMHKARQAIDAFFTGLAGEQIQPEPVPGVAHGFDPGTPAMARAHELGSKIRSVFVDLRTAIEDLTEPLKKLTSGDKGLGWFEEHKGMSGSWPGLVQGLPVT
jgi:TP901 family phage tail tape measure protein